MLKPLSRPPVAPSAHTGLVRTLRGAVAMGLLLVLLVPAARGHSQWLGWLPLWLLGMPAAALWSLHRFRLPSRVTARGTSSMPRRHRSGPQARRRMPTGGHRFPRAA